MADPPAYNGTARAEESEKYTLEQSQYPRTNSGRSLGSYGAVADGRGAGFSRRGSGGVFIRRTGSTSTTDRPFERQASKISSIPSGKSLASVRTRLTSVSRSEYHGDLKPNLVDGLNVNLVFTTFIIVFGSSFLFGYNIGVLNNPSTLIKDFYNETYVERYSSISDARLTLLWSLTTALFIPGGMMGAFLGGVLADKLGRKRSIILSHIFSISGAVLSCACVAAKAPELLMFGRILVGVNSGIGNCIAPMYITEITPFNLRGAFGTIHQLSITLGIMLSSVFGIKELLGTRELWPYIILIEALPALTSLIILPFLPDSPRYTLLVKKNRSEAEQAMQFFRRRADVCTDMEEMDTEQEQAAATVGEAKQYHLTDFLRSPDLTKPLFIACALQVVQQFSGINAVFFYSSRIYKDAGVPVSQIPFTVIGTNAVNVAMTIITVPLMDITGRRPLLLLPMLIMTVDLIILTVSLNLQNTYGWLSYVSIGAIVLYVIGFAAGLGPIPMMIGAELFRQGPRPIAMSAASVVNWIGTFVIALGFESVQDLCGNYTFIIFAVLMALFLVFVYFFVPETKNKTFEEIAHVFSPGVPIEVEEMLDDVFDDPIPEVDEEDEPEDQQLVTINFAVRTREYGEDDPPNSPPCGERNDKTRETPDGFPLVQKT